MKFIELTLSHDGQRPCEQTTYVLASSIVRITPLIDREQSYSVIHTANSGKYPLSVVESVNEIFKKMKGV